MLKKWLLLTIIILFPSAYAMAFTLTSSAWQPKGAIPAQYTCDGANASPPLAWNKPPAGTQTFALIMTDPDAPSGTWTHWVVFNIPSTVHGLPANIQQLPPGTLAGNNSWKHARYEGACPPAREHRYIFNLYALNTVLNLKAGVDRKTLQKNLQGHVIGNAELQGRYQRRR
jgi:Raf kinase inhibitor-like YbhB/YbcL family protein